MNFSTSAQHVSDNHGLSNNSVNVANEELDNYDTIDDLENNDSSTEDMNYEQINDAEDFYETIDTYEHAEDVTVPPLPVDTENDIKMPSMKK